MIEREIKVLEEFVTERRRERMRQVLAARTRYITVVLEDIYQPHNASAVLRSCDAFGIQDVHIVENRNRYRVNPGVELGTSQWLDLVRHREGSDQCIASLRTQGYRIVATTPHRSDATIETFDLHAGPFALMFGTEKEGLSNTALTAADEYLQISMVGFVESLNISVSAALSLYTLSMRLRGTELGWELSRPDQDEIYRRWLFQSVRSAEEILRARLSTAQMPPTTPR